ncbi:MAG: hypothetical protein WAM70_06430 [Pyrinomonadaceae bacterium]
MFDESPVKWRAFDWSSGPGNSSNPPTTLPEYMAVIVASHIQSDGSVITGDVKKIIVVKTNPGYGPAPGRSGTGQVVAILCAENVQSANFAYTLFNLEQYDYAKSLLPIFSMDNFQKPY